MFDLDAHVQKIRDTYCHRCDLMISTMDEYFPKEAKFTRPEGGLFTWVEMPDYVNTRDMAADALALNVAFVPGDGFFPNGGNFHCLRMNYSNMPDDRIVEGVKRIAEVMKKYIK